MRHRSLLPTRTRRDRREPVVPMINVVFLLLIFFVMTAQIVPPAPFDLDLPSADGADDTGTAPLYISADGMIAFNDLRGEAALAAAVAQSKDAALRIHVDAALSGQSLAKTLATLTQLGATEIALVTEGG